MKSAVLILSIFICGFLLAEQPPYPKTNLLVDTAELAKPDVAKQFVILDARERSKYDDGHVPNAIWVDHATWSKSFGDGDDAKSWSKRIAALGIDSNSKVVIYDDSLSKEAARTWWILRYWGLSDVRLLNGGWVQWMKNSFPIQKVVPPAPSPTSFAAQPITKRLATRTSLLESLDKKNLQIIDARSEGEFCGVDKLKNKRAGAIPGAKHLEWSDLLDKETQRFKSAEELRKLFESAGIDLNLPTATHCQSGGRSSVMVFGLELMGAKDVSNYYRSWGEWGNADDTPIEPGKVKK